MNSRYSANSDEMSKRLAIRARSADADESAIPMQCHMVVFYRPHQVAVSPLFSWADGAPLYVCMHTRTPNTEGHCNWMLPIFTSLNPVRVTFILNKVIGDAQLKASFRAFMGDVGYRGGCEFKWHSQFLSAVHFLKY